MKRTHNKKTKEPKPKVWAFVDGFDGALKVFKSLAEAREAARQCHCVGVHVIHPNGRMEWVESEYGPLP